MKKDVFLIIQTENNNKNSRETRVWVKQRRGTELNTNTHNNKRGKNIYTFTVKSKREKW